MTEADGEKSSEKRTRGGGNELGEDEMEQRGRVEGRREAISTYVSSAWRRDGA